MSNLLKRGTTVSSDERVIDYNDLVKSKLKHIIEIQNNKDNVDADGFVNGLKADVVEQLLTGSEDDMNEEAATDASYEAQAASIIENASNEAQSIKDEANEILAQAHMEADRLLDKAAQLARDYEAKAEQLTNEYEQLKAAIEPELVNTITDVFRKVTRVVSDDNQDIILGLIGNVLKNAETSNDFVIKVSPEDYKFLTNNQGKIYCAVSKEINLDIVADKTMKKNECIIETDAGVFDCSLDIELNNLIKDIKLLSCM